MYSTGYYLYILLISSPKFSLTHKTNMDTGKNILIRFPFLILFFLAWEPSCNTLKNRSFRENRHSQKGKSVGHSYSILYKPSQWLCQNFTSVFDHWTTHCLQRIYGKIPSFLIYWSLSNHYTCTYKWF